MMDGNDLSLAGKLGANICLSGGALGADIAWATAATGCGHDVVHWSFKGHRPRASENVYELDSEELAQADQPLKQANRFLKRKLPFDKPWIINLLRRNWYQIKYSDSVYAVGMLNSKAIVHKKPTGEYYNIDCENYLDHMGVNGGTAWACQLYFNQWLQENDLFDEKFDSQKYQKNYFSGNPCDWFTPFRLYFYDQEKRVPLIWLASGRYWFECHQIPKPSGIYTAVGTRNINQYGIDFIEQLYT